MPEVARKGLSNVNEDIQTMPKQCFLSLDTHDRIEPYCNLTLEGCDGLTLPCSSDSLHQLEYPIHSKQLYLKRCHRLSLFSFKNQADIALPQTRIRPTI